MEDIMRTLPDSYYEKIEQEEVQQIKEKSELYGWSSSPLIYLGEFPAPLPELPKKGFYNSNLFKTIQKNGLRRIIKKL